MGLKKKFKFFKWVEDPVQDQGSFALEQALLAFVPGPVVFVE